MRADLPMRRLAELFNVNHFIVSQVNPHIIPIMLDESSLPGFTSVGFLFKIIRA